MSFPHKDSIATLGLTYPASQWSLKKEGFCSRDRIQVKSLHFHGEAQYAHVRWFDALFGGQAAESESVSEAVLSVAVPAGSSMAAGSCQVLGWAEDPGPGAPTHGPFYLPPPPPSFGKPRGEVFPRQTDVQLKEHRLWHLHTLPHSSRLHQWVRLGSRSRFPWSSLLPVGLRICSVDRPEPPLVFTVFDMGTAGI